MLSMVQTYSTSKIIDAGNYRWFYSSMMSDCQLAKFFSRTWYDVSTPTSPPSSPSLSLSLSRCYININQSIIENDRRFAVSKDNALANTIHSACL